jgi:predicted N-acyltransferase
VLQRLLADARRLRRLRLRRDERRHGLRALIRGDRPTSARRNLACEAPVAAPSSTDVRIELHADLSRIDPDAWDALTGDDDPFVEHAFLRTLETSGSVGGDTGWDPLHVTVWDGTALVAALPLYVKAHSYGEFIFDFAWANASMRAGLPYYPKLVSMTPFTPATGRRVLRAPGRAPGPLVAALLAGVRAAAEESHASSAHLLFVPEDERALFAEHPDFLERLTCQYHWHAAGDRSFDDYLGRFRAEVRKQVRKERRGIGERGLTVRVVPGLELADAEWDALDAFYRDTCDRKGSEAYLAPPFFRQLRGTRAAGRVVAALAYEGETLVAGTLNLEKGRHLYGRYWGCLAQYDALHFELCYYQLIERAIARGCVRFEAGAQGEHKIKRGLVPSPVYSLHWLAEPLLARAVRDFLPREAVAMRREMALLDAQSPFHRGPAKTPPAGG